MIGNNRQRGLRCHGAFATLNCPDGADAPFPDAAAVAALSLL
jgi:hypothetical protein